MSKPISREYRIYLALWRKAIQGSPPTVKVPNLHTAIAMRQGMYRAIRPFRDGTLNDTELLRAAEKYVIYLVQGSSADTIHFLEWRERKALAVLEEAWDSLGIDEQDLLVGDERGIDQKLSDLLKEKATVRETKFFTREPS
jgi:hypothetical protein